MFFGKSSVKYWDIFGMANGFYSKLFIPRRQTTVLIKIALHDDAFHITGQVLMLLVKSDKPIDIQPVYAFLDHLLLEVLLTFNAFLLVIDAVSEELVFEIA